MIPILFEKTETLFTSNGLGRLSDCIRCIVTEERNGVYECEFDYPVSGPMFSQIEEGRIIGCTHDDNHDVQPFDIYGRSEPINGVVTFYAHHISYRLNEITVKPFSASSCAEALQKIKSQSVTTNPFTFWTDKSVSVTMTSAAPKGAKDLLSGSEGSILDIYGTGEYKFNKFEVRLYLHRGQDTNVSIRYGKNLVDFNNDYDASGTYTAVVPYWLGDVSQGEQTVTELVMLPELFLSSGHTVPSGREVVVPMDLSDVFEDKPSVTQLRTTATNRLTASDAWLPNQTVKVNFVQLWQTEEYKDYAPLQRLSLCDTCGIFVPMYDISLRAKVIRVVYNVLLDRYDEMELGDKPTTYTAMLEKIYDSKVAGFEADLKSIGVDIQTVQTAAANDATAKANAAETNAINAASADATAKANAAEQNAKAYADSSVSDLKDELETQIDAKIETWAQVSDPQAEWDDKSTHNDDLWLYTGLEDTMSGNQVIRPQGVYKFTFQNAGGALMNENSVDLANESGVVLEANGWGNWEPYASTSDNLFDLADGKSTIYYGSPTGSYTDVDNGDYLVDSSTGMTYRYQGGSWVKQTDYQTYTTQAVDTATEQICGGTGGYVITTLNANNQPIEILITDNMDINQAVNVWRWNQGGLGHSHNGYNGPFNDVAITQDGKINASMILTGALTANLITAGTIADAGGNNSWNLDTGKLTLTLGGSGDSKGSIDILDSSGRNGVTLNNEGIECYGYGFNQISNPHLDISNSDIAIYGTVNGTEYQFAHIGIGTTGFFYIGGRSGRKLSIRPATVSGAYYDFNGDVSGATNIHEFGGMAYFAGGLTVAAGKTKSREVATDNYDKRLLYCYETPTPLFGDIGEARIDEDGICFVDLDDIFSETIANQVEYQVFLQKEGEGDCWIAEKHPRYFVIQGTPNLNVAWELKAKQKEFSNIRLEQNGLGLDEYVANYDDDNLINDYITEQEALLYGNY